MPDYEKKRKKEVLDEIEKLEKLPVVREIRKRNAQEDLAIRYDPRSKQVIAPLQQAKIDLAEFIILYQATFERITKEYDTPIYMRLKELINEVRGAKS